MYTKKEYLIHISLFILTLIATTLAGAEWLYGKSILADGEYFLTWEYFIKSLHFSVPFLGILLIHELGHLFTSLHYKVKTSMPFFIPGWLGFLGAPSIGTFGAIIKLKSYINSRKKYFDIGVAGPLAGFIIAFGVLWYGFTHLPEANYIYQIHPEYLDPEFKGHSAEEGYLNIEMGYNLLFYGMEKVLAEPEKMPNMSEIIHFPYIFAGYLALFFTALNLLPIGQLDGGHVVFGLSPKYHKQISLVFYIAFVFYAGLGSINPYHSIDRLIFSIPLYIGFLYFCFSRSRIMDKQTKWMVILVIASVQYALVYAFPTLQGYSGWLLFAFLLGRVMGLEHPEVSGFKHLDRKRKILGWISIIIFLLCFTPQPLQIS
ncbi:site-2 protease family protein [Aquiflexum gelatinilyticum]|uniref:Site-2 protease family protein n=1 Tax=Aquiflexum gelatinilyticum TaxID=2961943 RepID=A0A9X2P8S7_9BACT|nr:site-2 protease family protein [Aquiflexum gelatinilyticum]MCR9015299.1 site-2 protease family protein [Aquiflexum gelatinilyticum]